MPEQINRTVPTQDELRLRITNGTTEPSTRLLEHKIDDLSSTGQRLDFIEQAENEAYDEELLRMDNLTQRVRELTTLALESDDRVTLMQAVNDVNVKFHDLKNTIAVLEEKYMSTPETPKATHTEGAVSRDQSSGPVVASEVDQVNIGSVAVTEEADTAQIEHDLSQQTRSEDFVLFLPDVLAQMPTEQLVALLEKAANEWHDFDASNFGIKLPPELSRAEYVVEERKLVERRNLVSPRHTLLANAAATLWQRRIESILDPNSRSHRGLEVAADKQDTWRANYLTRLQLVEKQADILFRQKAQSIVQLARAQMAAELGMSPDVTSDLVFNDNMKIILELMDPRSNISMEMLRYLTVSGQRADMVLRSLNQALSTSSVQIGLDVSMINKEITSSLTHNIGSNQDQWLSKLREFLALEKQLAELPVST